MTHPASPTKHDPSHSFSPESVPGARLSGPWRLPFSLAGRYVRSVQRQFPTGTPRQIVYVLERRYLMGMGVGAGVTGALSSIPRRTIGSIGLSGVHAGMWASLSAFHLLTLAHVYQLDPAMTKRLVSTCWVGSNQGDIIQQQFSNTWWRSALAYLPVSQIRSVQGIANNQIERLARKRGVVAVSKLLPGGLGVSMGVTSGRVLGNRVIDAAHTLLGDPPASFN